MPMAHSVWKGARVLVTGHTGFKGGWLTIWLKELGAEVFGVALPPVTEPSLWEVAGISRLTTKEWLGDIRSPAVVHEAFAETRPDVVFHLAAQPLVRESYEDPVGTIET